VLANKWNGSEDIALHFSTTPTAGLPSSCWLRKQEFEIRPTTGGPVVPIVPVRAQSGVQALGPFLPAWNLKLESTWRNYWTLPNLHPVFGTAYPGLSCARNRAAVCGRSHAGKRGVRYDFRTQKGFPCHSR